MNYWPAKELRITDVQADFLRTGHSGIHQRVIDRTELILESRRMIQWKKASDGTFYRAPSAKGQAALTRHRRG